MLSIMQTHGTNPDIEGMNILRKLFPNAVADKLNFVLFSTSGVGGTYNTIEEVDKTFDKFEHERTSDDPQVITYLIIKPRILNFVSGNCIPATTDDIEFLKNLRASSQSIISTIGF